MNDLRFRWTAQTGIDMLTGPAVPLRAYLESHRVGDFTLDLSDTYPGFQRAVPLGPSNDDILPDAPYQLWYVRPFTDPALAFGPAGPFYGNEYFDILDLAPIEGGYRAYVCDGIYNVYRQGDRPSTYVSIAGQGKPGSFDRHAETNQVLVWRVEFTDHPTPPLINAPHMVTGPQKGPNPAPLGDVFGPWYITGGSATQWGQFPRVEHISAGDAAAQQRQQQCLDRMPDDRAQREAIYTGQRNTPPPADPAVPGWPDTAA